MTRMCLSAATLLRALTLLSAALGLTASGCDSCKVMRINDGRAACLREIDPGAYAAYARGRLAELQGNRDAAAREYRRVLELDADAGVAWVRMAALECRGDPAAARRAWSKALELAADSHVLWLERARCALANGNAKDADEFARRALELGPSDPEVTLLAARVASRLGDTERESTLLFGALAVQPGNAALWTALATSPTASVEDRKYAVRRLLRLRPIDENWVPPSYLKTKRWEPIQSYTAKQLQEQLELALARRDTAEALRIAALLGVRTEQLALAALDAGFYSLAAKQAELLLALEPDDAPAWVIALVAADLSRDEPRFRELLARAPRRPGALDAAPFPPLLDLVRRLAMP